MLPQQARCKTGCKTWWIEPFKGFPAVSSTGNSAKHFQNTVLVWGKSGTWWETISVTFQFWKTYEHIKLPGNIFYWWNLRAVVVLESEQFVDTFVISVHKPSWSWQNKIQIITWKLKNSTACLFKSLISKISCLVSWVCNSQNWNITEFCAFRFHVFPKQKLFIDQCLHLIQLTATKPWKGLLWREKMTGTGDAFNSYSATWFSSWPPNEYFQWKFSGASGLPLDGGIPRFRVLPVGTERCFSSVEFCFLRVVDCALSFSTLRQTSWPIKLQFFHRQDKPVPFDKKNSRIFKLFQPNK